MPADIASPDSVRAMYERAGRFDAVVSAAGEASFGPFDTMSEAELALGIESKLLGQIRLVLLGGSLISDGGLFTLMSGHVLDDPIPVATNFPVANGGVKGVVRAAALSLDGRVRINAVSPGLAAEGAEQFGAFNPGRLPVPMCTIAAAFVRSVEGWRTGEVIRLVMTGFYPRDSGSRLPRTADVRAASFVDPECRSESRS